MAPDRGLHLRWERICFDVADTRSSGGAEAPGGASGRRAPLRLLHALSGQAAPGALLAVMGASGSGKTSLVQILAGRRAPSSGRVLANGAPLSLAAFRGVSGFVAQTTVFMESLTARRPGPVCGAAARAGR
jgi:ABC-type glutathione transport system ATPase component